MIQRLTRSTDDAGLTAAPRGEQELMMDTAEGERLRRWRLVLGEEAQASCGLAGLSPEDRQMDEALAALYEADSRHSLRGGSGASSPRVARWLGDIRRFFPSSVVQVMQKDAFERLNLHSMLLQPEMLESVQPDVNLVSTLMSLRGIIPEKTKETARLVVRKVVDALMKQLEEPMRTAVSGALNRAVRNRRPRHAEIDWNRTIRANLKHWQQEYKTIVPETLIGYGRKSQRVQREIILCIDQSGSMASSVVYSSIFGAVMASMPAVKTHLVVFDTAVVDMTEQLDDPVDLLFGVQLGGGTDINRAVGYCQSLIRDPRNTILVLISDLYEGGVEKNLLQRANELVQSGVQVITLLALSNEGTPFYDKALAAKLAGLGIPSFACTPDLFPGMMAAPQLPSAHPPIKQPPGSSVTKNRAFFHLAYSRNLPGSRPFNDWGLLRERSLGAMSTRQNGMKGSLAPSSPPPNASFPHSREQRPPGSAQAAWPHAVRRRHSETRSRRESRPLDIGLCRHYTSVYSAHRHGRKTACRGPYKIPAPFSPTGVPAPHPGAGQEIHRHRSCRYSPNAGISAAGQPRHRSAQCPRTPAPTYR